LTGRLSTQKKFMSSRQRAARDFPEPDSPVMTTRRSTSRLPVPGLPIADRRPARVSGRRLHPLSEPPRQLARPVITLQLEQVITGRDSDQARKVAARPPRHLDVRKGRAEDLVAVLIEAEPVVFLPWLPRVELDDVFDELRQPHGGDAEEVFDVDDADPAQLHVI